jgi:predicted nucleic acid-binding protein
MRYYLDTAPIIYLVEQVPPLATAVRSKLAAKELTLVISELTRLECRVKPLRDGNTSLLQDFDNYFAGAVAEIVPLTREVIDRATEIRARNNFKTPDALHLAAAVSSGCDAFLTNDHRLDRFTGITVEFV